MLRGITLKAMIKIAVEKFLKNSGEYIKKEAKKNCIDWESDGIND